MLDKIRAGFRDAEEELNKHHFFKTFGPWKIQYSSHSTAGNLLRRLEFYSSSGENNGHRSELIPEIRRIIVKNLTDNDVLINEKNLRAQLPDSHVRKDLERRWTYGT